MGWLVDNGSAQFLGKGVSTGPTWSHCCPRARDHQLHIHSKQEGRGGLSAVEKRGIERKGKEEETEQKRMRGKREKVKEPSTVSVTLTSEGEEEWDEVKRIEEEIEPNI